MPPDDVESGLVRAPGAALGGRCNDAFAGVRAEFERNFAERGELGAAVAVYLDDVLVVDLWGGYADGGWTRLWGAHDRVTVWSCTKGAVAACIHLLASAREIDIEQAVAHYWPAFRTKGKSTITIRSVLNHQAGVPGLSAAVGMEDMLSARAMAERVAWEPVMWEPGTRHGYHAMTYGWILDEVVVRVSGQTVGRFFGDRFADRWDLDFQIGVPPSAQFDIAETVLSDPGDDAGPFAAALGRGAPVQRAVMRSFGPLRNAAVCNDPATRAAEIPAANGVASGKGLAGFYRVLASPARALDQGFDRQALALMSEVQSAGAVDASLLVATRYSCGFQKSALGPPGHRGLVLSAAALGHGGLGGSLGFADPPAGLAFGYAMNRHAAGRDELGRVQPLVDAVYEGAGFRHRTPQLWMP
ncbi:MAG: serine hydrolase domain-containing protein [Solirubrobacteraceae bacterium]